MKACPICGSLTFDDADTCYGCLYRFAPGEGLVVEVDNQGVASIAPDVVPDMDEERTAVSNKALRFTVDVSPRRSADGILGWCCSVQRA